MAAVTLAVAPLVLAPVVVAAPAQASTDTVSVRLRTAVKNLPTAVETRTGYDRAKFSDWIDADGDCRDEVPAAESLVAVKGCDAQAGEWRFYYDGVVTRDSSSFDIDHLVALAEAWDSGAKRWTANARARYATTGGTTARWWR